MKKILAVLYLFTSLSIAQEYTTAQLNSMYDQYALKRFEVRVSGQVSTEAAAESAEHQAEKCGFGIANIIKLNIERFSPEQQNVLKKLLNRPGTDTSIVSPGGFFRIHFYKSGSEVPSFDVNQFALAADSAYRFEINFLGYSAPPVDNGGGGDDKYDVYILNLGNLYGQTLFDFPVGAGSGKYTSYMEIDNDFAGFNTTGLNASKVTVAHEFHHAIQIGNYIFRDTDIYFYELTSTSMEVFVYPSIPDYYQYLPSYFNNTTLGFASHDGYDLAIWNIFLQNKFGYGIIKRQWELMPAQKSLVAINTSLVEQNSSFGKAINEFGIWTHFTNYRTVPGIYFSAAADYPLVHPLSEVEFTSPSKSVQVNAKAASNNFITFKNAADTLTALITNVDYQTGIDSAQKSIPFTFTLFDNPTSGSIKLTNKYSANLTVSNQAQWMTSEFLNNQLIKSDTSENPPVTSELAYAYPSPFYYNKIYANGSLMFLPVPLNNTGNADVNVYTSALELVYSANLGAFNHIGHYVVKWNGRKSNNEKLPSGIYLFVTKSGENVLKGKLVIFNE